MQTQIVYLKPPADGALPDPASTFNVVHTPFDTAATNLQRHGSGATTSPTSSQPARGILLPNVEPSTFAISPGLRQNQRR